MIAAVLINKVNPSFLLGPIDNGNVLIQRSYVFGWVKGIIRYRDAIDEWYEARNRRQRDISRAGCVIRIVGILRLGLFGSIKRRVS